MVAPAEDSLSIFVDCLAEGAFSLLRPVDAVFEELPIAEFLRVLSQGRDEGFVDRRLENR